MNALLQNFICCFVGTILGNLAWNQRHWLRPIENCYLCAKRPKITTYRTGCKVECCCGAIVEKSKQLAIDSWNYGIARELTRK